MPTYAEVIADRAFEALADPTRRAILDRLRAGQRSVTELADGLPVSRPAVSQHLRVLEEAGLVRFRPDGTRRLYRVDGRGVEAVRQYLDTFWADVLTALKEEAER